MAPALLAAIDSAQHVHLIVGASPIAAARCTRSLEVGANPILIAPKHDLTHHGLHKRIEDGQLRWIDREVQDTDFTTLGREEVNYVVDAVFVTLGPRHQQSR